MKKNERTLAPDDPLQKWFNALDNGPTTTLRKLLEKSGPVPTELWPLLQRLADINVTVESTDHLDDAALYAYLIEQQLDQPTEDLTGTGGVLHIDVIGGFSEEDIDIYLRYYADDQTRTDYTDPPAKETPPFDRDQHMPLLLCEREDVQ